MIVITFLSKYSQLPKLISSNVEAFVNIIIKW